MKQDDIWLSKHYRLDTGARVQVLKTRVKGFSGRRDSVRVKYVGGPRDGAEADILSREILREWGPQDEERAQKRAALNKKVGAARVRLATLDFTGDEVRVMGRGDGTIGLNFYGAAAERVLEMLERASEEAVA